MNSPEKPTKRIDQLLVKVSGRAYLGEKLEIDQDVRLVIEGQVAKIETMTNQDGSVNICYIIKAMTASVELFPEDGIKAQP